MAHTGTFVERVKGALMLDPQTYADVAQDKSATGQAMAVVALATMLSGARGATSGALGIVSGVVWALLGWAVFAVAAYALGTTLLKGRDTRASFGQVLRATGFAYAPSMFSIFVLIPFMGFFVFLMVIFWSFAASIVSLQQVFQVSTVRALVIALVSVVVIGIVLSLVFSAFGLVLPTGTLVQV